MYCRNSLGDDHTCEALKIDGEGTGLMLELAQHFDFARTRSLTTERSELSTATSENQQKVRK